MSTTSRNTIVGLFENERSAQRVVDELAREGFSRNEVHLSSSADYASGAATGGAGLTGRTPAEHHGGGFMGWLESIFGSDEYQDEDISRYDQAAQRGGYVVAVDTEEMNRDRAIDIMNDNGVVDIDKHAATHGYGQTEVSDSNTGVNTASRLTSERTDQYGKQAVEGAIPVVEEQLKIGKRTVQRGGVRVYSHVIEQPVEEDVQLREEKVRVERRPVDRAVTDADVANMRDQSIEVREMAEEAVVEKQARVVEEVRVGKETTSRTQKVRETVRRTEVKTEDLGAGTATDYTQDFRKDYQTRFGSSGGSYETYAPAYDYGYRMAGDPRYTGKNWTDVESTLKTDYLRNNPNSTWDQAKGAVRYGWEKVTGQR